MASLSSVTSSSSSSPAAAPSVNPVKLNSRLNERYGDLAFGSITAIQTGNHVVQVRSRLVGRVQELEKGFSDIWSRRAGQPVAQEKPDAKVEAVLAAVKTPDDAKQALAALDQVQTSAAATDSASTSEAPSWWGSIKNWMTGWINYFTGMNDAQMNALRVKLQDKISK